MGGRTHAQITEYALMGFETMLSDESDKYVAVKLSVHFHYYQEAFGVLSSAIIALTKEYKISNYFFAKTAKEKSTNTRKIKFVFQVY